MNQSTNQLVEHFFRHESANLIAVLTRAFGMGRIEMVEDMVQVAMLEAMNTWKQVGIPDKPAAWIHRAARNRILDALRREKTHDKAVTQSDLWIGEQVSQVDQWLEEEHLPDSLLRMIFVCCHPSVERKTQIALTLKTLCGFGISEVARGLLLPEETVKKRIQRARRSLAQAKVSVDLPGGDELARRLDVVHDVLYLLFNEGYSTSLGAEPIRDDICEEAVRLCHMLCESRYASPTTRALLALMLFHAARLDTRVDAEGAVVLLEDQDREKWDHHLIGVGRNWLARSRAAQPTTIHLEAAIAMQHCIAPSVEATDWGTIIALYDRLLQLHDSPVYALNRAIAVGQAGDARLALEQLLSLRELPAMKQYPLLDCALASMHELAGDADQAVVAYEEALRRTTAPHETKLIERKLRKLRMPSPDDR